MRNAAFGAFSGALLGAIALFAGQAKPETDIEQRFGLPLLREVAQIAAPTAPPSEVYIVGIDRADTRALGLPDEPASWPRAVVVDLTQRLHAAGARVVAFDLLFHARDEPDESGQAGAADEELARTLASIESVVLVDAVEIEDRQDIIIAGLVPLITQKVLMAPFPLSNDGGRVEAFWTNLRLNTRPEDASAPGWPTLPVAALELLALEDFEVWLKTQPDAAVVRSAVGMSARQRVEAMRSVLMTPGRWRDHALNARSGQARAFSALVDTYSGNPSRYFSFFGAARRIPTISLTDVLGLSAESLRHRIKDKVIFVGVSDVDTGAQRDAFATSVSVPVGPHWSGVELAATAFSNLLEHQAIERAGHRAALAQAMLVGGALGALLTTLPAGLAAALSLAVWAAVAMSAMVLWRTTGYWLPIVSPSILVLIALLICLSRVATAWRQRSAANRYESFQLLSMDQFATELRLTGRIPPDAAQVRGVCMAVDAKAYSLVAQVEGRRVLGESLGDYYAEIFTPALGFGGRVVDLVGGAMAVMFADGNGMLASHAAACNAALEMVHTANRDRERNDRTGRDLAVVVDSGSLLVGKTSSAGRFQCHAAGDAVRRADILLDTARAMGASILITERAVNGVNELLMRELGSVEIDGSGPPTRLFEIIGRRQNAAPEIIRLVRDFAEALASLERGCLADAAIKFVDLLQRYPGDRPSRFYLRKCERMLAGFDRPLWPATLARA